jgi:hypothetical protein
MEGGNLVIERTGGRGATKQVYKKELVRHVARC